MKFRFIFLTFLMGLAAKHDCFGQTFQNPTAWGAHGLTVVRQGTGAVELNHTVGEFTLESILVGQESLSQVLLPGHFMHQNPGLPDLPGRSYFVAMPSGATPLLRILEYRSDTLENIAVVPAPILPADNSDDPPVYKKDPQVYQSNAFFPGSPVMITRNTRIRGTDVAQVGLTPFSYNPVTRQLVVYYDMKFVIEFQNSSGVFGDERYRSRFWDPILRDFIINHESLPAKAHSGRRGQGARTLTGCEYLIISPDGAVFQQWADSIKLFRSEQGILTQVVTLAEVGGNTAAAIEAYIDNAYYNWDIPPDACLLLGDYGTDGQNSIISHVLNDHPGGYNPYISDNPYADVTGDLLPDIAFARITARNATELGIMVSKFLSYERNPPLSPDFYEYPITALGWQTTRWFQICSEAVGGFFKNELGKDPVRINEIYEGNPNVDPWSTASNTTTVLNYFGPSGQGYLPATPATLGNWTGGNAADINSAIESGAFLLQHRDHGYAQGWGEPVYNTSHIATLTNSMLTFVLSINCQTGKFNATSDCLAEKFHRHSHNGQGSGALGVIAPTEVSYSFVNDTYTWGFYDHLWPEFMPTFTTNPTSRGLLPCFGNVAGKYYLEQSTWPPVPNTYKIITYKLFHYHGDAFSTLYSEVPQSLQVSHGIAIQADAASFEVTADADAFISLSVSGEIIGTAEATGNPVLVDIAGPLQPGETMVVTITKKNHLRYRSVVSIIPADGPYVMLPAFPLVNDSLDNNNGLADHGESVWLALSLYNAGDAVASNVVASISATDDFITLVDSVQSYGNIQPGQTKTISNGFRFSLDGSIPDLRQIDFNLLITDGMNDWPGVFHITAHAPLLGIVKTTMDEISGNGNWNFEPGETASYHIHVTNSGTAMAAELEGVLSTAAPFLTILDPNQAFGSLNPGDTAVRTYTVVAGVAQPEQEWLTFHLQISDVMDYQALDSFDIMLGRIPALVLDLDPNNSSGPLILNAITANGLDADYATVLPANPDIYQSIFVCLGVYNVNHVLSAAEGQVLATYLQHGGNLYMEGGDTWVWDPKTDVHPMFRINGLHDGFGNLATVTGATGSYAEGLSYVYAGPNNFIDQLGALAPAFVTFSNSSPAYHVTVSHDAGSYRTIGSSFEFGGLTDGTHTKVEVARRFMDFFGIPVLVEWLGLTADWHSPANWSNGLVPDKNTIVAIPAGVTQPSQFSGGAAGCRAVLLESGGQLLLPPGTVMILQLP